MTKQQSQNNSITEFIECIVDSYDQHAYPIKDVWESFTGWYWFAVKKYRQEGRVVCYGYVVGLEKEWGTWFEDEVSNQKLIWKVPRDAWKTISHVTLVDKYKLQNGV